MIQTTDRNGRIRRFSYDAAGRQIEESWWNGDTQVRVIHYSYDAAGNLVSASDPDSVYTFTFDALNRVTTVDNAGTPGLPHVILSYTYDAVGNVLSVSDNLGVQVSSTYDTRNLLISRAWQGVGIAR